MSLKSKNWLNPSDSIMARRLRVDQNEWAEAADDQDEYLKKFGGRLPKGIWDEHETLKAQLRTNTKVKISGSA